MLHRKFMIIFTDIMPNKLDDEKVFIVFNELQI